MFKLSFIFVEIKFKIMKEQYNILSRMQEDGYNVVTCGNCGDVILLETYDFIEEVQCPHCKETMDYCDMPDLYHA